MAWSNVATHTTVVMFSVFMAGTMMAGCSSAPEPQPEPSKQEIRQDSDRFFQKMGQEEGKKSPSP
jgi:outer membrane murein-binding lipoprotein Lpp